MKQASAIGVNRYVVHVVGAPAETRRFTAWNEAAAYLLCAVRLGKVATVEQTAKWL